MPQKSILKIKGGSTCEVLSRHKTLSSILRPFPASDVTARPMFGSSHGRKLSVLAQRGVRPEVGGGWGGNAVLLLSLLLLREKLCPQTLHSQGLQRSELTSVFEDNLQRRGLCCSFLVSVQGST